MCLSTAWELDDSGGRKMLGEHIAALNVDGNTITLTDLMGNDLSVTGILRSVDLTKNTITISTVQDKTRNNSSAVKRYERVREVFNKCGNSQMRDIDIREIETADVDEAVEEFCHGKKVSREKFVNPGGAIVFEIDVDGLAQRVSYTEL